MDFVTESKFNLKILSRKLKFLVSSGKNFLKSDCLMIKYIRKTTQRTVSLVSSYKAITSTVCIKFSLKNLVCHHFKSSLEIIHVKCLTRKLVRYGCPNGN